MNHLVLLKNQAETDWFLSHSIDRLAQTQPVALTLGVFHRLTAAGKPATAIWEYCDHAEAGTVRLQVKRFLDEVYPLLLEGTGLERYGSFVAFDLVLFLYETFGSARAIRSLLRKASPATISVFDGPNRPCIEQAQTSESDVFSAVATHIATECRICVQQLDHREIASGSAPDRTSSILANLRRHWRTERARIVNGLKFSLRWPDPKHEPSPIVFLMSSTESERHSEMIKRFQNCKWKPVCISENNDGRGAPSFGRAWDRATSRRLTDVQTTIKTNLRAVPRWATVVASPHLEFQWKYLSEQLLWAATRYRKQSTRIIRQLRPKMVVMSTHNSSLNAACTSVCDEQGVPTLMLPHSAWFNTEFREFTFAKSYIVPGEAYADVLRRIGVKDSQILRSPTQSGPPQVAMPIRPSRCRNILLLTGDYHSVGVIPKFFECHPGEVYRMMSALVTIAGKQELSVTIKSHPVLDYYDLYDSFAQSQHVTHKRTGDLRALAQDSLAIVGIGVHTSALWEAMAIGRPLIFCPAGARAEVVDEVSRGAVIVRNATELQATIRTIYNDVDAWTVAASQGMRWLRERLSYSQRTAKHEAASGPIEN